MTASVAVRSPALAPMLRRPLTLIAVGAGLATILIGVHYAGTTVGGSLDNWIRTTLKALIPDGLSTALVIDFGGEPVGAVMLSGLLAAACFLTRRWRLGVLALVGQVVIGGATNVVKPLFDRTIHDGHLSYPSGHTAGATALAFVLGLLIADLLRLGLRAALATVLSVATVIGSVAALAQAWLVAHYATDTVGGYLMALGLVPPTALLIDWIGDHMFGRTSAKP